MACCWVSTTPPAFRPPISLPYRGDPLRRPGAGAGDPGRHAVIGFFGATITAPDVSRDAVIIQFGLSGAATVLVAGRAARGAVAARRIPRRRSPGAGRPGRHEARFRTLADSAPVLMWVSNLKGPASSSIAPTWITWALDYEAGARLRLARPDPPRTTRTASPPRNADALESGGDFVLGGPLPPRRRGLSVDPLGVSAPLPAERRTRRLHRRRVRHQRRQARGGRPQADQRPPGRAGAGRADGAGPGGSRPGLAPRRWRPWAS